jgi:hypothetical protein
MILLGILTLMMAPMIAGAITLYYSIKVTEEPNNE